MPCLVEVDESPAYAGDAGAFVVVVRWDSECCILTNPVTSPGPDETPEMDEQHEREQGFGWLVLSRGTAALDTFGAQVDYRADTEAGLGTEQRASPEIRHEQVRGRLLGRRSGSALKAGSAANAIVSFRD